MNINWYPGHMAKSTRLIRERLNEIDAVIELCDARIPQASRNPVLEELVNQRSEVVHILWLNKADLADSDVTHAWETYYAERGIAVHSGSSLDETDRRRLIRIINEKLKNKVNQIQSLGIKKRDMRLMMIGIPNCGNRL